MGKLGGLNGFRWRRQQVRDATLEHLGQSAQHLEAGRVLAVFPAQDCHLGNVKHLGQSGLSEPGGQPPRGEPGNLTEFVTHRETIVTFAVTVKTLSAW